MKTKVTLVACMILLSIQESACNNTPGNYGEPCNLNLVTPCEVGSECLNNVCDKLCTSFAECNGGSCETFSSIVLGKIQACADATGGGGGGSSSASNSSSSGGSCSTARANNCQNLTNECSSCGECQAPCYCAAACDCNCAGDSQCEQSNRAAALELGTTCSY